MAPDFPVFRPPADADPPGGAATADPTPVTPSASGVTVELPARTLNFHGRDNSLVRVLGWVLAHGTSERTEHAHSVPYDLPADDIHRYAQKHERCSACRWFEVTIARVEAEIPGDEAECTCASPDGVMHEATCGLEPPSGRYLVVTAGRTIVPGEQDFRRAEFTDSPYEVVELLVQRRKDDQMFIPQTSLRALAQAASRDADIREAYLARTAVRATGTE